MSHNLKTASLLLMATLATGQTMAQQSNQKEAGNKRKIEATYHFGSTLKIRPTSEPNDRQLGTLAALDPRYLEKLQKESSKLSRNNLIIGYAYISGIGIPVNIERARAYLNRAEETGTHVVSSEASILLLHLDAGKPITAETAKRIERLKKGYNTIRTTSAIANLYYQSSPASGRKQRANQLIKLAREGNSYAIRQVRKQIERETSGNFNISRSEINNLAIKDGANRYSRNRAYWAIELLKQGKITEAEAKTALTQGLMDADHEAYLGYARLGLKGQSKVFDKASALRVAIVCANGGDQECHTLAVESLEKVNTPAARSILNQLLLQGAMWNNPTYIKRQATLNAASKTPSQQPQDLAIAMVAKRKGFINATQYNKIIAKANPIAMKSATAIAAKFK